MLMADPIVSGPYYFGETPFQQGVIAGKAVFAGKARFAATGFHPP
jgi:hypothetical protein